MPEERAGIPLILCAVVALAGDACAVITHPPDFLLPTAVTRYSTPLKLSAALGVVLTRMTEPPAYDGIYLQVEPGFGGIKINTGFRAGVHRFIPAASFSLGPSLMHTWGDPLGGVDAGLTFAGFEAAACLLMLNVSGGFFARIGEGDGDDDMVVSLGIGAGF